MSDELRVLHWNVHSWRDAGGNPNVQAVVGLVAETAPDVVTLMEVDEVWGAPSYLQDVADRCGYSWMFVPAFEFGSDRPAGGFGNALLTRLPVLAVHQWQLLWPTRLYDGSEPSEQRSALLARLRFGAVPFWAGATHMPREDTDARTAALERLVTLVHELTEPWLICGDFNTPAATWAGDLATSPERLTYPAQHPAEAIDYCICSEDCHPDSELLLSDASDHLPQLISASVVPR